MKLNDHYGDERIGTTIEGSDIFWDFMESSTEIHETFLEWAGKTLGVTFVPNGFGEGYTIQPRIKDGDANC